MKQTDGTFTPAHIRTIAAVLQDEGPTLHPHEIIAREAEYRDNDNCECMAEDCEHTPDGDALQGIYEMLCRAGLCDAHDPDNIDLLEYISICKTQLHPILASTLTLACESRFRDLELAALAWYHVHIRGDATLEEMKATVLAHADELLALDRRATKQFRKVFRLLNEVGELSGPLQEAARWLPGKKITDAEGRAALRSGNEYVRWAARIWWTRRNPRVPLPAFAPA